MGLVSIAMLAAKFAPSIIGMFAGDDAEEKAEKVIGIAKAVTGIDDPAQAVDALHGNPELEVKFREAVMNYQLEVMKEETTRIGLVNATMQAESKSEHWMQWSWRPFNGFLFGITLFGNYIVLPIMDKTSVDNIEVALMAWSTVLGVSAWHRGKEKLAKFGIK